MKIDVKLSLDDAFVEAASKGIPTTKVASGWVEIEETFKFHVFVFNNREKNKMFVSYPSQQEKNGERSNIVFPVGEGVREEVEAVVLEEVKHMVTKGMNTPQVTSVKINMLSTPITHGKITTRAMATIELCGFAINGIVVKESERGLFVQMPQYVTGEGENRHYNDTVYGTSSFAQERIKNAVLQAYEEKQKEIKPTEPEQVVNRNVSKEPEQKAPRL